jgi:sugar lactone lactonase YvrE
MAFDRAGNIIVADTDNYAIRRVTPAGVVSTVAGILGVQGYVNGAAATARFNYPYGVAVDAAGNIYVADANNNAIRKIDTAGNVTTFAGGDPGFSGEPGVAGTTDGTGSAALFKYPQGITVDAAGNLYVADTDSPTIRKVTPGRVVTTVFGAPGSKGFSPGTPGSFSRPVDLTVSADGSRLWVVDMDENAVFEVTLA